MKQRVKFEEDSLVRELQEMWGIRAPARGSRIPKPTTADSSWKRCKHWGGDRLCECCQQRELVAGHMARAQVIYLKHNTFVKKRLHAELLTHTNGTGQHEYFDDIEGLVWEKVASNIDNYESQGVPLAWLRKVVRSVVEDYFDSEWAKKRDIRKTQSLGDYNKALDQAAVVDECGDLVRPMAKPTSPEGRGPDDSDDSENKVA